MQKQTLYSSRRSLHVYEISFRVTLLSNCRYGVMSRLLGDAVLTNKQLEYLLTNKFLLHRYYQQVSSLSVMICDGMWRSRSDLANIDFELQV